MSGMVRVEVSVPIDRDRAYEIFTAGIGTWAAGTVPLAPDPPRSVRYENDLGGGEVRFAAVTDGMTTVIVEHDSLGPGQGPVSVRDQWWAVLRMFAEEVRSQSE
jgi:hypothetical protein